MQSKVKTTIYAILNEIMEDAIIGASAIDIINKINLIRRKIISCLSFFFFSSIISSWSFDIESSYSLNLSFSSSNARLCIDSGKSS